MKMKKLILGTFIIFSCLSFSEESDYQDFSMKEPVIRTGLKEAKENISRNFIFNQGDMYRIYAREGFLTTILLQPGEEVVFLGGGDTSRWAIEQAITGSNEGERTAIYIKPFQQEIKTNLVINTNKRQYHFFLQSSKNYYNPLVSFLYPREAQLKYKINKLKDEKQLTPVNTEDLFFGYKISHSKYKIAPVQVFDDGQKTFLVMKNEIKTSEAPVIYVEDALTGDIALVNYRIKGNYYIVDRIFDKAVVKLGKKEVKIKKTVTSNKKDDDKIIFSRRRGDF
jgi:type IV secretion system protein VirB9